MGLVFADLFYLSVTQTIAKEDRDLKKFIISWGTIMPHLSRQFFSFSKLGSPFFIFV